LQSEKEDKEELMNEKVLEEAGPFMLNSGDFVPLVTRAGLGKKADAEAETEAEVFVSE
jgi:hypothetical protein